MKNKSKCCLRYYNGFPVPKRPGFFFFSTLKFGYPSRLTRYKVLSLRGQPPITSIMFRAEGRARAAPRAVRAVRPFPFPPLVCVPSIATSLCAVPSPRIVRR